MLRGDRWRIVLFAVLVLAFAAGTVLRFWATSPLWLDEALTVNIARAPLSQLPALLRNDGAPPLYYALLHGWMALVGHGQWATRALSGLIGEATVVVGGVAAARWAGARVGWATAAVLATAPFAIRYSTEVRMYALEALLVAAGALALSATLGRPTWARLGAVAVLTGLLLYNQYWSMDLVGAVLVGLAVVAWRRPSQRAAVLRVAAAITAGMASFAFWLPVFLYQSAHTKTPWAVPPDVSIVWQGIVRFAGGTDGILSTLDAIALAAVLMMAIVMTERNATRKTSGPVENGGRVSSLRLSAAGWASCSIVTAGAGLGLAVATGAAFTERYLAVILVPVACWAGVGIVAIAARWPAAGVAALMLVAGLGLAAALPGAWASRTQAATVDRAIASKAEPGDVVAFCPDQLGPAVTQSLALGLRTATYPRDVTPRVVDWSDYDRAIADADPVRFARQVLSLAGSRAVYYVWAPGYLGFGHACQDVALALGLDRSHVVLVRIDPRRLEGENLWLYAPSDAGGR